MEPNRISAHASVRKVYDRLKNDNMTTIWDRFEAQGMGGNPDQRCPFCLSGARCDLCSNGPCRADAAKDKLGVCGINADGMAMRMMLLRNLMGASTYHYHTEQTLKTLKATTEGKTPFEIKEKEKLKTFAGRLGLPIKGSPQEISLRLIKFTQTDFSRKSDSLIVKALAPAERQEAWHK